MLQLLELLIARFSHLKSKWFRGRLTLTENLQYGRINIYESDYVEFIDHLTGEHSDLAMDIYYKKHAWRVNSTNGSVVNIGVYRRDCALREAERIVGRVLYVDDLNKIIFCKSEK